MTSLKNKKLIIVGDSAFAEIACEYFTHDSLYEVAAFSVETAYIKKQELLGRPVVAFEDLVSRFPPGQHEVFVAIAYAQLNRLRARLCDRARAGGYALASYVSSRAFVWPNVALGDHVFVFEDNTLQPFVRIGNNVVLWSGNHIGHHSIIHDNCFIASHAVVSGFCQIGRNSFLGVNSTIANNVNVGEDNWIGPGVLVSRDTAPDQLFNIDAPESSKVSAKRFFKVKE